MSWSQRAALERVNYYGDSRVREAMRTKYYEVISLHNGLGIIQLTDSAIDLLTDCGDDEIPDWYSREHTGAFHVKCDSQECYQCGGEGTMVNPSIDAGGISQEDFYEDPDFEESYFSGAYDVQCSACAGSGLCQEVTFLDQRVENWIREMEVEDYAYEAERLAELRMGC